jgi:ectoine hydroxylase-related dioxygenase (phytanoyl-CoA dioxygenase family)
MGPTTFLPRTNTLDCHDRLKSPTDRADLLASSEYRRGVLKKGDCTVMDSRTFHFGDANESERRRVLFYFTIRNPQHQGEYPPCGSLFPDLNMTINDYY